jgi:S-DNA-T family DNA segregation ATPase FtsK/SpoIIIE
VVKLKLTVVRKGVPHNLQVTADGTATVGDIAAALAAGNPTRPEPPVRPGTVTLKVTDVGAARVLDPGTSLIDSGLRSGMRVEVAAPSDTAVGGDRGGVAAVVRVLSGPAAGTEVQLPFGSAMIGRVAGNDVVLRDELVSKHHARLVVGDGIEIIDQNSANGVLVGGQRVGRIKVGPDDVVTVGDTQITVIQVRRQGSEQPTSTDIPFTRSPSVLPRIVPREIDLPVAPKPLEKQRFPLLAMVAPLAMGATMYALTQSAMSLVFVALSPIIMLGTYIDQRVRGRQRYRTEVRNFDENLDRARTDLEKAHELDRHRLLATYPSVEDAWNSAVRLGPVLWWRRPEHPEFLQVRLGLGEVPPITMCKRASSYDGVAEFEDRLTVLQSQFATLEDAPVLADLRSCGSLGLCGDPSVLDGVARGLMVQLICMHSPAEVGVVCLTSRAGVERWDWLQWTPHTSSPHSPLGSLHLASDPATGAVLLSHIEELIDQRAGSARGAALRGPVVKAEKVDAPVLPSLIVLVDDALVDRARLTRVAERGPDVGVHVVWCASTRAELPAACRTYLEVDAAGSRTGQVRRGEVITPLRVETVDRAVADRLGRVLAPVLDAGVPVEDASDLPKSVTMVTLTGQELANSPDAQVARWRENQSIIDRRQGAPLVPLKHPVSLRAVVGHAGTDSFTLDLRHQGPHALVGGTTGAGKSEFLQAWVLGMAAAHSPDRVSFLFVDYKGGSAFARCLDLPHVVGLVTDLSPYLVRRALTSLRAELRFREHLLNEKGAKDLAELEKRGDPDCPPSLVIVVDEFAALVGEVPEFVDGVVDVAQRGRSLGLHLILATQRPAGVIKDNLRANTNLRVALRMADEHDSADVLGEKTAAFFDPGTPGRAAAKTGPGRIVQFQAAYPGAKTPAAAPAAPVDILEMNFGGGVPWQVPERKVSLEDLDSDIERLVANMSRAATSAGVAKPRKPWLDALARTYDLRKMEQRRDTELTLGVIDDPENQEQRFEYFRPDDEGNIAYYGAGGSGKTTALRSLALAASITPRSGGVHVYGLDYAGGGLGLLEPLPNVGSIIDGGDEERIGRLFRWLRALADERQARYSAAKAPTLSEYRRITGDQLEPRILVLLDGIGAFRADYEGSTDRLAVLGLFQQLLVDGRGVGIHFAVTADRPAAVPTSLATSFQRKVVLRQTDDDGYRYLDLPRDVLTPTSPPGRAMQVGKPHELQLAILGDNINVAAQSRMVEQLAEFLTTVERPAPHRVEVLGTEVQAASMPPSIDGNPVLGVADETLAPVGFNPVGASLIWGPAQSGRTNALAWFAESLSAWRPDLPLVHLSARRSPLSGLDLWTTSATGLDACEKVLQKVQPILAEENHTGGPVMAMLIEGYPEFLSTRIESLLIDVVKSARTHDHILVAEGESSTWNSSWPLLMEVRNARCGLLLQPDYTDGDSILRTPLPRFKKGEPPPGRGYWVRGGKAVKVQLPRVES